MDNRLRFLYYSMTELWGRRRESTTWNGKPGQARRGTAGKTAVQPKGVTDYRTKVGKCGAGCREKPLLFVLYPYRKPTQVDEERILRPTEEALLRNSAK